MHGLMLLPSGAAYGRAEAVLRQFVEISGLPFLPTPMGKGVLPDDHPNCVAAARSRSASSENYLKLTYVCLFCKNIN